MSEKVSVTLYDERLGGSYPLHKLAGLDSQTTQAEFVGLVVAQKFSSHPKVFRYTVRNRVGKVLATLPVCSCVVQRITGEEEIEDPFSVEERYERTLAGAATIKAVDDALLDIMASTPAKPG